MSSEAKTLILMYHRVAAETVDPWGLCVSPDNFREQMQAIAKVAAPLSMQEFMAARESGTLPLRSVVVTFDDGYLDNLTVAAPILREHSVPATLFVCTGNIGSGLEFWWDRLENCLLRTEVLPASLELALAEDTRRWELGPAAMFGERERAEQAAMKPWNAGADTRLGFFEDVWNALRYLATDDRDAAVVQLEAWSGASADPQSARRTLSEEEIRELDRQGSFEIGAHTVDHLLLPAQDPELQAAQILGSRQRLEEILRRRVGGFAYPHGEFGADTVRILDGAGFDYAVTVKPQVAGSSSDRLRLPRFGVRNIGAGEFLPLLGHLFTLPVEAPAPL